MSTKRQLYKPAPTAQTPPQAARRSLSQGRLTSTDPKLLQANGSPGLGEINLSQSRQASQGSHVKRSFNYGSAMALREKTNKPSHQISPTITHSPAKVQPSASLSLSEPEDETRQPEGELPASSFHESSVLAVDASYRHGNHTEVPIKASYIKSPAKVVCHSPKRKTTSEIRDSPLCHGNAGKINIPVETVPSVNVSTMPHSKNESRAAYDSPPPSEDGSLSTVAGSPVDPRSKAVETAIIQEKGNPRSYVSFLDSGSCTDVSLPSRNVQSIDQSEVEQPNFDDTGISSVASISSRLEASVDQVGRKKKKKTRVVQSKYMTSAMSRTGDKQAKRSANQSSKNTLATGISLTGKTRKTKTEKTTKPVIKDQLGNETIMTNVKKPLFTSTPEDAFHYAQENKFSAVQKVDRSHFAGPSPSQFASIKEINRMKASKDGLPSKDNKPERATQVRSGKQNTSEISQLQRDLIYARFCQWRFLNLKQRDTFKKQEKQAQEMFYSMSQLNKKMKERNHELRTKLEKIKKEEEIDEQLKLQLKNLETLDAQTLRLLPNYEKFYQGLDTTRHYVSLQDIHIPQNEDELLTALKEFENNAEEVTQLLHNNKSQILSFCDEMQSLAETVQTQTVEHERCTELLAAANSLTTQEQSLKAELIERNEP